MKSENIVFLIIAGLLVGVIGVPMIASVTSESINVSNDGAGWVKLAYTGDAENTDYEFSINLASDVVTIGTMSGSADDMTLYADNGACLLVDNGTLKYLYDNDGVSTLVNLGDSVTVSNTGGTVTVSDGNNTVARASPSWAYYPQNNGVYSSFGAGDLNTNNDPVAVSGSYAGVVAYNGLIVPDVGLTVVEDVADGRINSVSWGVEE